MAHEPAKRLAKIAFGGRCIFTGLPGVDGMHLYPVRPYWSLSDEPLNIFPGIRERHSLPGPAVFDLRINGSPRPVSERRWMLESLTWEEARPLVLLRLKLLRPIVIAAGEIWFQAKRPQGEDYAAILRACQDHGGESDIHGDGVEEVRHCKESF